jgi:hypothetical protein
MEAHTEQNPAVQLFQSQAAFMLGLQWMVLKVLLVPV